MIGNYRAAGARCLIVNGVVDPVLGMHADLLPRAALTVCRLRAGRDWPGFSETARRPRAAAPRPDASAAGEVTTGRDANGAGGSILLTCAPRASFHRAQARHLRQPRR